MQKGAMRGIKGILHLQSPISCQYQLVVKGLLHAQGQSRET